MQLSPEQIHSFIQTVSSAVEEYGSLRAFLRHGDLNGTFATGLGITQRELLRISGSLFASDVSRSPIVLLSRNKLVRQTMVVALDASVSLLLRAWIDRAYYLSAKLQRKQVAKRYQARYDYRRLWAQIVSHTQSLSFYVYRLEHLPTYLVPYIEEMLGMEQVEPTVTSPNRELDYKRRFGFSYKNTSLRKIINRRLKSKTLKR